jgi:hypothetical protein
MFLCVKVTHVKTSHSLSHHFWQQAPWSQL